MEMQMQVSKVTSEGRGGGAVCLAIPPSITLPSISYRSLIPPPLLGNEASLCGSGITAYSQYA